MGIARRALAHLVARRATPLSTPRTRAAVCLGALLLAVAGVAWSAAPVCACGGGPGYEVYEPFTNLPGLVDFDGEGADIDGAYAGPHAFAFSFLAPFILADSADRTRADELADLAGVWERRNAWAATPALADTASRPQLSDTAFLGALRRGALDRAAEHARALVMRALDMPAGPAQAEQPLVQRAVEFLELQPQLVAADGPRLARFFAAPPPPRDTPRVPSTASDSVAAARVRAWRRAQVARVPDPVPSDSLPPALRAAAALRRLSRAELAQQAQVAIGSPRLPSLRFVGLQERTRALIPAGWPSEDPTPSDSARRRALRAAYAAWLTAYPTHPLADLVRLSTVRADRLVGDTAGMWATLFSMYPRHRARVVAEMYTLLVAGEGPPAAMRATIADPLLRAAFVFREFGCPSYGCSEPGVPRYDHTAWDAAWRRAQAARPARWAVNVQERLLRIALADSSAAALPEAFPATAESPTPLWGTLRLALLVRALHWEDAAAQAALLPAGRTVAALRFRIALHRGEWARALGDSALHPDTRRYLLQVLAPDSVLAAIAAAPDHGVRGEAVRTQAARLAGAGRWRDAARVAQPVAAALSARYDTAGALAVDRSSAGQAALARYLVGAQGELLGGADDRDWYRAVESRWLRTAGDTAAWGAPAVIPGAPWTPAEERIATRRFLLGNSELYLALGAYADALRGLPSAPSAAAQRRALARAADVPYNRLVNRNYGSTVFWPRELARDSNVAVIRRAGRSR